ncbi:MAG: hypothetical protein JWP87_3517 [Labilithrix sp.]|nr:hypothetical protein [Labilithrix sp.]
MTRRSWLAARGVALLSIGIMLLGCEPSERVPARGPKPPPCPPPPEPAYQGAVVGTIGKMHMIESRYPLSKLGDVLASFKPDLVLVAVRVDPFREGHLEDASFEMTYVANLAKQHGVAVEPIDWFREQDLGAPETAAEPWDEASIAKREAEVLVQPRLYNFEQANGAELEEKVLLATDAEARHRTGNPLVTRRHAWMQHLSASAVSRHGRPKRVLAYVDVLDRPAIDLLLHGVGYTMKEPVALVSKSKDEMISDIPLDVMNEWKAQLERARAHVDTAKTAPEKAFWTDRQRTLQVVIDKRAACCVPQAALATER